MGKHTHLYNNTRWRKKRKTHLIKEPLCRMCRKHSIVTEATVVDHIIPHRGDIELFWKGDLQSLCAECHNRHKKMQENGGLTMGCDEDGLPIDDNHYWSEQWG